MGNLPKWISVLFVLILSGLAAPSFASGNYNGTDAGEYELGVSLSSGTMSNGANIASRSVTTTDAFLNVGFKIWNFVPFLNFRYLFVNQMTDPAQVNNQNMSGDGYNFGAGLKIDMAKISVAGGYTFFGSFQLSKKTTANETSVYSAPSGFFVKLDYNLTERAAVMLVYSNINYTKQSLGGTEIDISSANLNHTTYGLGLSYKF